MIATTPTSETTFASRPGFVVVESRHDVTACERCGRCAHAAADMATVTGSASATNTTEDRRLAGGELVVEHSATVARRRKHERHAEGGSTLRRAAEVIPSASDADVELLATAAIIGPAAGDEVDVPAAAKAILRSVSFLDDTGAFEPRGVVTFLVAVAELDADSPAARSYSIRAAVGTVANAARRGYSIGVPATYARLLDELDAFALGELAGVAETRSNGSFRIGAVKVPAQQIRRDLGETAAWYELVEIPEQSVELILAPSHVAGRDAWISAKVAGTSVRRHGSGAPEDEHKPTEHVFSGRAYEVAKTIAGEGRFAGGPAVLSLGVELVASRYRLDTIDPTSRRWTVRAADGRVLDGSDDRS